MQEIVKLGNNIYAGNILLILPFNYRATENYSELGKLR